MSSRRRREINVLTETDSFACRHPLGATGGRLLSSLIYELRRTGQKAGVATLCMGTGAGKATLISKSESPVWLNLALDISG